MKSIVMKKTLLNISISLAAVIMINCTGKTNQKSEPDSNENQGGEVEKTEKTEKVQKHQAQNYLTDREEAEGWKLLFDGTSFYGWKNFGREGVEGWKVENGELIALGEGGDHGNDIITKKQYQNFELSLEWQVQECGNSGIFFNVVEEGYDRIYATAPEYQLLDDYCEKYVDISDKNKSAANYDMHTANPDKKLNPAGEWNESKIIVDDGKVSHFLNGDKVLEYELWTKEWESLVEKSKWKDYTGYGQAKKGHIGLQDHGGITKFRNIKILHLSE